MINQEYEVKDVEFYGVPSLRDVLIIGHPRFGSGYISSVLRAASLDVGHERVGSLGTASWMFAVKDFLYPYGDTQAYHKYCFSNIYIFIKDPIKALPSCVVENKIKNSYEFRRKHVKNWFNVDLNDFESEVDRAAVSIIYWYKICELQRPIAFVNIDDKESVERFIKNLGVKDGLLINKALNTPVKNSSENKWKSSFVRKVKPELNSDLIDSMNDEVREKLFSLRRTYGYTSSPI